MRIIILGVLTFLGWAIFGNYYFVCKVRGHCGDTDVTNVSSARMIQPTNPKNRQDLRNRITSDPVPEGNKVVAISVEFTTGKEAFFSKEKLAAPVRILDPMVMKYQQGKIFLVGHTADDGEATTNYEVGKQWAELLKKELVNLGFKADRILIRSQGEVAPLVPNSTESNRKKNKRVEVYFQK
ncbi:MAG: OmpA family protein [Bacteroidota bacterium]